jgi:hypothetical protein
MVFRPFSYVVVRRYCLAMTVSQDAGALLSTQIAQVLRDQIEAAVLRPGDLLPTEEDLAVSFGVSREPVRNAISTLVTQGFIIRRRGVRSKVASDPPARLEVIVGPGAVIMSRTPLAGEAEATGAGRGAPLLVVRDAPGAEPRYYPADRTIVTVRNG